jgi:hypothetical protein
LTDSSTIQTAPSIARTVKSSYRIWDFAESSLERIDRGSLFRGGLDFLIDGKLRGWALSMAAPNAPVRLRIWIAGVPLGEIETFRRREDLERFVPDNVAGFDISLTHWGQDGLRGVLARLQALGRAELGKPADIRVELVGYPTRLGSHGLELTSRGLKSQLESLLGVPAVAEPAPAIRPWAATAAPASSPGLVVTELADTSFERLDAGSRYRAALDYLKDGVLKGWAVDLLNPQGSLRLCLSSGGVDLDITAGAEFRQDLDGLVPGNKAGFLFDFRSWPDGKLRALGTEIDSPVRAGLGPCRLRIRLDNGPTHIDIGAFGVTDADFAREIHAVLTDRQAEAQRIREAERARAAPAPALAETAQGEGRLLSLARILAEERRQMLDMFGAFAGEPDKFRAAAREFSLGARRLLSFAMAEEIRSQAILSECVKTHALAIADLFDPDYYKAVHGERIAETDNALLHYVLIGWRENLRPNPLFDPEFYRRQMGGARGDPLLHYVQEGAEAGLDPYPLFDTDFYRAAHMGGADSRTNPLFHYMSVGGSKRFDPSPFFRTEAFLASVPHGASILCPLEAFVRDRALHDRAIVPAFDPGLYRFQIEIERGQTLLDPPVVHYLGHGYLDETLLPNLFFDPAFYRERNEISFEGPALLHYLREGDAAGLACHHFFSAQVYNGERGEMRDGVTALEHAMQNPVAMCRSDRRMKTPLDAKLLQFLNDLLARSGEFDVAYYRRMNGDLGALSDDQLRNHWREHGRREGRIANPAAILKAWGIAIRDIPLGFFADEYAQLNPDLQHFEGDFLSAFGHFILLGRNEKFRMIGRWQFFLEDIRIDAPTTEAPLRVAPAHERVNVCVLIHAFYPDIWQELAAFAQNFRNRSFDIFINLVDLSWTPELHQEIQNLCPGAFVQLSNDSGRDIGGFTRLLDNVEIGRYDSFAFMHTKKSPHIAIERAEHWRRTLLKAFAGSPEVADECVDFILSDPSVGMIGSREWRSFDMGKNIDQYERLLDLLGVTGANRELDYISGFMFLVRGDIVQRLHSVLKNQEFEYGGDKGLEFHVDGQIAHGVERALPALVRHMGYKVVYR